MASLGHVALGMAAARLQGGGAWRMAAWSALSLLPDADVIAFALGIPYRAPFGHRGASHSLAFAALMGVLVALATRSSPAARLRTGLLALAVVASHPLLDALTDGGLGVALFWPFSDARHFAPIRPIPVAPIGARLLSERGLHVMGFEALLFAPIFAWALWPRRRSR